jgi:acid phosphatase family membrane protein YuiD
MMIELFQVWLHDFVTNTFFLAVASSFALAQFLKFISYSIKMRKLYWQGLFESGGLPSGHSAVVASLSTIVFVTQGFSVLFYVVFFLSCIVMYDAMGVRRETGKQGVLLNRLIKRFHLKFKRLQETVGHSPLEVFFGALLGVLVTLLYFI